MRWSWPAFGAGVVVGIVACLVSCEGEQPRQAISRDEPPTAAAPTSSAAASVAAALDPSSTTVDERPARRPRRAQREEQEQDEAVSEAAPDPGVAVERTDSAEGQREGQEVQRLFLGRNIQWKVQFGQANGTFAIVREGQPAANAPTQQALARARRAAEEIAASGRSVSDSDLDAMLASDDDGDREAAIGVALAARPPQVAILLRAARDRAVGGSLRATALLAAVEAAPADADVAAAVVALTSERNVDVRRTAIELLPRIGEAGAARAVQLLREGASRGALLPPIARAVAQSARALEFLLDSPDADAAFAVLHAIRETPPADPETRARLFARLPDAVRPLLGTQAMLAHAGDAFAALADAAHAPFLRSVATSASSPTALRLAAVNAAVDSEACADARPALLAAVLSDLESPVELLRAVLARVPRDEAADPGVKAAMLRIHREHSNDWLAEEARAKLQASPPPAGSVADDGALQIVSGVYGKDGKTVDVTQVLASMVVGGRLVVEAGNALAGDPLVGVVKDLAVTYVWRGARRTRTIAEHETLTLP